MDNFMCTCSFEYEDREYGAEINFSYYKGYKGSSTEPPEEPCVILNDIIIFDRNGPLLGEQYNKLYEFAYEDENILKEVKSTYFDIMEGYAEYAAEMKRDNYERNN